MTAPPARTGDGREAWLVYLELIEGYVKTIQSHHEKLNDEAGRDRSRSQTLTLATHSLDLLVPLPSLIRRAARLRAIEELEWFVDNGDFANFASKDDMRTRLAQLRAEQEGGVKS